MTTPDPPAPPPASPLAGAPADPLATLRSRSYLVLLVLAGLVGVPVSFVSYWFLEVVDLLQGWLYHSVPTGLGFAGTPAWWPVPVCVLAGVVVALAVTYLPGTGGHRPAEGFTAGGVLVPRDLPGVVLAAIATLASGVVLGPEAPLIAIGGILGVTAVRLAGQEETTPAAAVLSAAGGFAAISTLFGSPLLGAFLLMEASGLGGPLLGMVLVPGLLAAGIGSLVFLGLDSLTGLGTFSLTVPGLPPFGHVTVAMFLWALAAGVAAGLVGTGIRRAALVLQGVVEHRILLLLPLAGATVAGVAIAFSQGTGRGADQVLFSGQDAIPALLTHAAGWTVGAALVLALCKAVAYTLSLSGFRGGPVFPAIFVGAAGGLAASHLPGLSLVPAVAMAIGAMVTVMLGLPLTATLLATLLLGRDGVAAMPVVIVAVVTAYVVAARLPQPPTAPATPGAPVAAGPATPSAPVAAGPAATPAATPGPA